ncbi:hypothetical protein CMV_002108 [Castanea mollissima]|uniref:Uncharacterized protein n=1 Tax=Castanea mollissima TaxID=60419 RepID=A0A8J4VWF8_9ROSI|nr:hypothetical protein CMV_002108 [Castanea mollissima]
MADPIRHPPHPSSKPSSLHPSSSPIRSVNHRRLTQAMPHCRSFSTLLQGNEVADPFQSKYLEVAKQFKREGISFLIGDLDASQGAFQYFGLSEDQVPLIIIQNDNGQKYLKANLEPDHILPWVKAYKVIPCFFFFFSSIYCSCCCLWLSGLTGLIAYNWSQPTMKTSVKIIHARSFSIPCPKEETLLGTLSWVQMDFMGSGSHLLVIKGSNIQAQVYGSIKKETPLGLFNPFNSIINTKHWSCLQVLKQLKICLLILQFCLKKEILIG